MASALRDEGGYDFKKAITDTLITFTTEIPEAREFGLNFFFFQKIKKQEKRKLTIFEKKIALSHLCEFIEDCEHTQLLVNVLHVIGREGPLMTNPSKYIRYIYNRVILEGAPVRAAAVTALARFAARLPNLRDHIVVLLQRSLNDPDDEVRDRASFYVHLITHDANVASNYLLNENVYSVPALEKMLSTYCSNPEGFNAPFEAKYIPLVSKIEATETKSNFLFIFFF